MSSIRDIILFHSKIALLNLNSDDKEIVGKFLDKLLEDFRERDRKEKLSIKDWGEFTYEAAAQVKEYAMKLKREDELKSYQQKVISAISHEKVNWQIVQSKLQWIGNFSGHQVAYNQILQLPPITDEFEEAILAYNRAVVTLRKEASRQSLLFVDIRKELSNETKN